jgi:hypothetical protein
MSVVNYRHDWCVWVELKVDDSKETIGDAVESFTKEKLDMTPGVFKTIVINEHNGKSVQLWLDKVKFHDPHSATIWIGIRTTKNFSFLASDHLYKFLFTCFPGVSVQCKRIDPRDMAKTVSDEGMQVFAQTMKQWKEPSCKDSGFVGELKLSVSNPAATLQSLEKLLTRFDGSSPLILDWAWVCKNPNPVPLEIQREYETSMHRLCVGQSWLGYHRFSENELRVYFSLTASFPIRNNECALFCWDSFLGDNQIFNIAKYPGDQFGYIVTEVARQTPSLLEKIDRDIYPMSAELDLNNRPCFDVAAIIKLKTPERAFATLKGETIYFVLPPMTQLRGLTNTFYNCDFSAEARKQSRWYQVYHNVKAVWFPSETVSSDSLKIHLSITVGHKCDEKGEEAKFVKEYIWKWLKDAVRDSDSEINFSVLPPSPIASLLKTDNEIFLFPNDDEKPLTLNDFTTNKLAVTSMDVFSLRRYIAVLFRNLQWPAQDGIDVVDGDGSFFHVWAKKIIFCKRRTTEGMFRCIVHLGVLSDRVVTVDHVHFRLLPYANDIHVKSSLIGKTGTVYTNLTQLQNFLSVHPRVTLESYPLLKLEIENGALPEPTENQWLEQNNLNFNCTAHKIHSCLLYLYKNLKGVI